MPIRSTNVGDIVSELMHSYKKKGSIGKSKPKNKEKARKQALAIAFGKAKEEK